MSLSSSTDNYGLRLFTRYVVLTIIAIVFAFPLIFMIVSSLKPDQQLLADTSSLKAFLPVGDISFQNYEKDFLLYFYPFAEQSASLSCHPTRLGHRQ